MPTSALTRVGQGLAPAFLCSEELLSVHLEASTPPTARAHIANEMAPASGVPILRSGSTLARPMRGRRSAVAFAASSQTWVAAIQAVESPSPAATLSSSMPTNGTNASTIVLSPICAFPKSWIASSPARMAPATLAAGLASPSSPSLWPTAPSAAPHRTPEVPPALASIHR